MNGPGALRRGAAWVLAGKAGDQFLTFAVGIVLARLLAPEVFGTLLTVQVFTGLAGFVAGGGMGQALVRAKTVDKTDFDIVFTLQLLIGLVLYSVFFFAAPLFARWYEQPLYTDLMRLSALTFLFRPFMSVSSNLLHRQMRYRAQTAVNISCLVLSSTTSITLALLGWGVWSLVWGGFAGALGHAVLYAWLTGWRPGLSMQFRRGQELARYGMLVSANDIVEYVRSRLAIFALSHSLGPASVGLFGKGESLAKMPNTFFTGSAYQVLFRAMAAAQHDLARCQSLFLRSATVLAVYATPIYVGLWWLAEPLVRGVYGEKWAAAAGPIQVLALAWPFWLYTRLSGAVTAATGRLGEELRIQVASTIVNTLALAIGLKHGGLTGAAWAVAGSAAFSSIFMHRVALRALGLTARQTLSRLMPALLLCIPLVATLAACDRWLPAGVRQHDLAYVAVASLAGGLVYASCVLGLPLKDLAEERALWLRKLRLRSE